MPRRFIELEQEQGWEVVQQAIDGEIDDVVVTFAVFRGGSKSHNF